jgi:3-oxoacyl-[acyl-carrier-protein] synthase-1
MKQCYLNALGILCSAGDSKASVKHSIKSLDSTMTRLNTFDVEQPLLIGQYRGVLPAIPLKNKKWHSRNNQFALAALQQIETEVALAINRYGKHRIGIIIGTSTSGIAESESSTQHWLEHGELPQSYDYGLQEMGATAHFIAETLDVRGPVFGISTACSSGAKALASAKRLIDSGICDAVIAGGVDTLCKLTVQGFSSLQAVSDTRCNPFSINRNGINIGEGAALFLVSNDAIGVALLGAGEGSDAHHISAPDPSGQGAIRSMSAALTHAGITAETIDYVNLHGTATPLNDHMEAKAIHHVFGDQTLCSSTKPFTGHTLGAAGAIEAGLCWLMLENTSEPPFLPLHIWDGIPDPELPDINLASNASEVSTSFNYVLSNSFAFGGNNISLVLGRIQ